jgi:glycosyltransferase 2 family protein
MRKFFLVVVALLAVAYLVFSFAELESILAALRQSQPIFLGAAIAVAAVLMLNTTATFWAVFRLAELRESGRILFIMVTAATFVNLIMPASGLGGMAVFLDEARWRGLPTGRVLVAGILYVLYEYIALFAALAVGFVLLAQRGKLNAAELLAAGFILILAVVLSASLVVGYKSTHRLGNMLAWLVRVLNRLLHPFSHKEILKVDSAYTFANELTDGLASSRKANLGQILLPLIFTLLNKMLLIAILALAFLALGTPVSLGTVVAGFSVGHLFVYASPTPSGVGFVDSILPLALSSLDVPFPRAVLVSLVYRAVTFWLPLGLGALAFRALQRSRIQGKPVRRSSY